MGWSEELLQQLVNGISNGAVYGSLALALVLVYRASGLLNFAQGEMALVSTYGAWALTERGIPVALAILASMVVSFAAGALIERVLIRPIGPAETHALPLTIVTIGMFISLNAFVIWHWGTDPRTFPRLFGQGKMTVVGAIITHHTIGTVVSLLVVVGLLFLLFQRTKLGLAIRAVASNHESSRLVGVPVGVVLMVSWGMAASIGALAGGLIAGSQPLSPLMMQFILVYVFASATLGGFDSPLGAVIAGMIVGVFEVMVGRYVSFVGTGLATAATFALILGVLLVRPQGLLGSKKVSRV